MVTYAPEAVIRVHTASDGYAWKYREYAAAATPGSLPGTARQRIIYLHGIQSHGGWYERSCSHLAAAGFPVYFLDRRGSGLNDRARGDTPSFRRLLDDVAEFLTWLKTTSGPARTILIGVSWGGKLAAALQRRHPGLVDAVALLCPGFCPQIGPSFSRRLWIFLTRLVRPRKRYPIPLNDPELFTATPRWLEFLRNDPLALHDATARFLVESGRLDLYLRWTPQHVRIPVLLMLAERDRIIDNRKTRAFVDRFATTDRKIIEYPEAHHTLEFEPDPGVFLNDLTAWVRQQAEGTRHV